MSGADQRAVHRVHFVTATTLNLGGKTCAAQLLDISLMGAFIILDEPVAVELGAPGSLTLALGPEIHLELVGKVARVAMGGERLAMIWDNIDVDSASHLRRLLELNLGDHALIEQDIDAMYRLHVGAD